MFHREGQKIILFSFLLVGVSILLAHFFIDIAWLKLTVQILGLIILIIILQFFRNPKRLAKKDFNEIFVEGGCVLDFMGPVQNSI